MATLATRITSTGTLFVNGSFDEITTSTHRVSTNTVYASFLDEVTYNANSGVANKNLANYSVYNAGTWFNIFPLGASVTSGIDAPDGSLTAVRFSCNNTTNALLRVNIPAFTPTGTDVYTVSFYARHMSGSKLLLSSDLHDNVGVIYNYSGNLITGQWVRITYSGTPTATLTSFVDVFGDATTNNVIDYWGLQIEKSTTATIYSDTFNGISNPAFKQRIDSSGALYIAGQFDEVAGMIATNGLILQFDPGKVESFISNSNRLIDISGNTRNATLLGSVTYSSTSSSLLFDSPAITVDNRIDLVPTGGVDNTIYFTDGSEYTIECWCKIASDAVVTYHSIAGRGTTNPWLGILKDATDFKLFFRELGATYFYSTAINASVFTGWTQVVFSVNASRAINYYINHAAGTFTNINTATNTLFTINRLAAGYSSGGNYYAFDGNIGSINIYNRALSAAEVSNNFEALRGRFGI